MIIGLTGGIGSGKSTVARLFEVLGCAVFHSDIAAREVYFDEELRSKVHDLLGKESYLSDTELNKAYISSKIFGDAGLRQSLNALIHPAVGARFKAFIAHNTGKLIVKESALLFEAKLTKEVDKIIVVAAPDELRIQRVMARDRQDRDTVLAKLKSQLPQEEKIKQADFVIDNSGKQFLITQVVSVFNQLQQ